ncbi:MAG: hypothetical protein FJ304_03620 [Planctomycetes bacterium]|nr:hypothetical protein [Planctomycetota bacterium]
MPFVRPKSATQLTVVQKRQLIEAYFDEYRQLAESTPDLLNRKIPRDGDAFAQLLDQIGELLVKHAETVASQPGPVAQFLSDNPLPASLAGKLPNEFRVFCLTLNALKQWVAAEQAATDRYLLGGTARELCRAAATNCILSGESLVTGSVDLHHPLRDGRPPIPLSKVAHAKLEGQVSDSASDALRGLLSMVRRSGRSWAQLRRGCLDLLERPVQHSTPAMRNGARAFAREASLAAAKSYQELIDWLDEHKLGAI